MNARGRTATGRRLAAAGALAAALAGVLVVPAAATDGATLRIGVTGGVDTLDPLQAALPLAVELRNLVYRRLTEPAAADFTPGPALAASWKVARDATTWTFTLHRGLSWSDGQPLTSADVDYTLRRILGDAQQRAAFAAQVSTITGIGTPDPRTVVLRTSRPTPLPGLLSVPILPAHVWKRLPAGHRYDPVRDGVGSGPFTTTAYTAGRSVELAANPHYHGNRPQLDHVRFRMYADPVSVAHALRRGEIDFAEDLDTAGWDALDDVPGIRRHEAAAAAFDQLVVNTGARLTDGTGFGDGHPALADRRVRAALSAALDRPALVRGVLGGHGVPGSSVIPSAYRNWYAGSTATDRRADPAAARRLLAAAGYRSGADGVRRGPGGRRLSLRLLARAGSEPALTTARLVGEQLAAVGVGVHTVAVSARREDALISSGRYDLALWGWTVDPDPSVMLSIFDCGARPTPGKGGVAQAGLSDSFYCNRRYDALDARQRRELDPTARAALIRRMQRMLRADAPYLVLYYRNDLQAYSTRLAGLVAQPSGDGRLLFADGPHSYGTVHLADAGSGDGGRLLAVGGGAALVTAAGVGLATLWLRRRHAGLDGDGPGPDDLPAPPVGGALPPAQRDPRAAGTPTAPTTGEDAGSAPAAER